MCKITIIDDGIENIAADARVDAETYLSSNSYIYGGEGNTGYIESKVKKLFAGIEANARYTLHLDRGLTFNNVFYEAPQITVTPKAVGYFPNGHAYMQTDPPLTESARRKAEPIVEAALKAVQQHEQSIIEAAKKLAVEMINRYADDLIASAQAAKDQAEAAQ